MVFSRFWRIAPSENIAIVYMQVLIIKPMYGKLGVLRVNLSVMIPKTGFNKIGNWVMRTNAAICSAENKATRVK